MDNERAFWEMLYRALMMAANAIKRYKLNGVIQVE